MVFLVEYSSDSRPTTNRCFMMCSFVNSLINLDFGTYIVPFWKHSGLPTSNISSLLSNCCLKMCGTQAQTHIHPVHDVFFFGFGNPPCVRLFSLWPWCPLQSRDSTCVRRIKLLPASSKSGCVPGMAAGAVPVSADFTWAIKQTLIYLSI